MLWKNFRRLVSWWSKKGLEPKSGTIHSIMNLSNFSKCSRIYSYLIVDHYISLKNVASLEKTRKVWITKFLQAEYFFTERVNTPLRVFCTRSL